MAPSLALGRIAVPKASDLLAEQLREQILTGDLAEGLALPVERELAASVGLSRGVVRDALRVLEREGLVTTRPGRAGGSFVRRPDATTLHRGLKVLMRGAGARFGSLLQVREALEPAAAELAARNRTEEDLLRLDEASQALREASGDIPTFLERNADWHVAVVAASHNEIMHVIVGSLTRAIVQATDISEFNTERTMAETLTAHDRILAAVRAEDPDRARTAMARHVHGYHDSVAAFPHPAEVRI